MYFVLVLNVLPVADKGMWARLLVCALGVVLLSRQFSTVPDVITVGLCFGVAKKAMVAEDES